MAVSTRTPKDWSTGDTITATLLDGMAGGRAAHGSDSGAVTGVNTSETTCISWSQTNPSGKIYLFIITALGTIATDGARFQLTLYEDSTQIVAAFATANGANDRASWTLARAYGASSGTHTYTVKLVRDNGSGNASFDSGYVIALDCGV